MQIKRQKNLLTPINPQSPHPIKTLSLLNPSPINLPNLNKITTKTLFTNQPQPTCPIQPKLQNPINLPLKITSTTINPKPKNQLVIG
jgi:hypothetical protein